MGLGKDGTLHGTYESRSCAFSLDRPVSRKTGKTKTKLIVEMGCCKDLESKTIHTPPISPIESWGVCFFLQVAQTAASHCMDGVGGGKVYFLFFKLSWQNVREDLLGKASQLILLPIVATKRGLMRGSQEKGTGTRYARYGRQEVWTVWTTLYHPHPQFSKRYTMKQSA